jgi:hypothetical protein
MESGTHTWAGVFQVIACIQGRYRLAKGFLKIRSVLVSFIWKETLPTPPHTGDSGVEGGPVVAKVYCGHQAAQIVFNNLAFPLPVSHANADLECTLASGDEHISYLWSDLEPGAIPL